MNIALIGPQRHALSHRVRGTGFYTENLKKSLLKYDKNNKYFFPEQKLSQDLSLAHYTYFEPFFLTLPLVKKTKTIVTVHDLTPLVFPKFFPKGIKGTFKWEVQKISLRGTSAVITDSKSSKEDIIRFTGLPAQKVHVVYLAASEHFKELKNERMKQAIKSKYSLPDKFALYVGDVTWNKNLLRLIEAVKKTNIPLVLVGKALVEKDFDKRNPWNQNLAKVQELAENDKQFIRLGFVEDNDLIALYNVATLFVMPSLYEGFGLPILEAMVCGCPVVTTKEGSLGEVAGDAAFYVDAYDSSSIAEGIKEVFHNEGLRSELSKKGLAQAGKFSWQKTALETVKVYETL